MRIIPLRQVIEERPQAGGGKAPPGPQQQPGQRAHDIAQGERGDAAHREGQDNAREIACRHQRRHHSRHA